ncbi:polynucleotide adenylyltransferase PcnB [Dokdonella sp.]|uniref:polynucleotide adenylyltransferase PcnB n=1 Tax=Dokdonella sp. TaxID=2291710 RepID=UPI001B0C3BC0|nr:polynucleotide adenylyltransferase PcnB [Dokdonella sp.]MBO9662379.1 polynucleotide adenylyltransferase PcnB [Dokdonella sp.]
MNSESIVRNAPVDGAFRIIPRAEHSISRRDISPGALRVLYRLREAGFRACLVGGAVRDLLLGGHPKDFDVATDATPEQVRAQFRNCRLIGRRFRLAHVVFGREIVEVATFRGSSDDGSGDRHLVDGRLVRDNVYGSIEEDAVRRDFTINALYYDIADFSVRDAVGGMDDLERRTLRLIGDPEQRYREDPVRMLRAARLAAKLDFEIAADTAAPFATLGPLLAEAPPARLFDEALKLFLSGYGLASFRALERYGLLQHVFPATARALSGGGSGAFRHLLEQTLANTDARVREDKPVTPAFLFAAMLWEPARATAQALIDSGSDASIAWPSATARVLREQAQRVAIPRRFTLAVEEIWSLQPRFASRTKKRVFRLLEHPRFRAAYDFLLLRAHESAELAELAQWWTEAQEIDQAELATRLNAVPAPANDEAAPPKKRKRRRRRKASSSQASSSE